VNLGTILLWQLDIGSYFAASSVEYCCKYWWKYRPYISL